MSSFYLLVVVVLVIILYFIKVLVLNGLGKEVDLHHK